MSVLYLIKQHVLDSGAIAVLNGPILSFVAFITGRFTPVIAIVVIVQLQRACLQLLRSWAFRWWEGNRVVESVCTGITSELYRESVCQRRVSDLFITRSYSEDT